MNFASINALKDKKILPLVFGEIKFERVRKKDL